ncbi:hypothetical protein ART_1900 [Arthrobacter sp. PAMC 25486]|nr:hypothetical protein ART_1900 [Arthrobacter sp. PAMC 25486]
MDVERAFTLVDAINRALLNTCLVLDIHARLRNYVRHEPQPSLQVQCPAQIATGIPIIHQRRRPRTSPRLSMK